MPTRHVRTLTLVLFVAGLGLLACDASTLVGSFAGGTSKPTVTIQSPANGSQFRDGEDVAIQSQARDSVGIVRVELSVDGAAVRTDQPPVSQGQVSFTVVQKWKATAGSHTLSVRAFNASGVASDPALVAITVSSAGASPEPTTAPTQQAGLSSEGTPAVAVPSSTSSLPTATLTRRPATRSPATATISAPPGVYATNIRVAPPSPRRGENVTFYVTFLNTTGSPQGYRWRIRIYIPEQRNSFGDTAPVQSTIPVGQSQQTSSDNWAIRGGCDPKTMTARVFWIDADTKQETEFVKPDKSGGPATDFLTCPP